MHKAGCLSPWRCNCYDPTGVADPERIVSEVVYDVGPHTLTHQKRADGLHRLVDCDEVPQKCGKWVGCNEWATVGTVRIFRASYDNGVEGGKRYN